ncbi:MAG: hypothetical protein A2X94_16295 [Bdellovibrionales bacterium GWB1_55_8]|nr:MAG: hypothetical protein A2X94_16295 [Bdellovibrionales bacterium GWB1_55_8]
MKKLLVGLVLLGSTAASAEMISVTFNEMDMKGNMKGASCTIDTDQNEDYLLTDLGTTKFKLEVNVMGPSLIRVAYLGKSSNAGIDVAQVSSIATPYQARIGLTTALVGHGEVSISKLSDYPGAEATMRDLMAGQPKCVKDIFKNL